MDQPKNYFHLHLISDSTGETLITVGRAAAAQFTGTRALEHIYPLIRTVKQLEPVLDTIDGAPGIVLYTVVDTELSQMISNRCREMNIPCVSVLDPVIALFQSYLGPPSEHRVGAQHSLNAEYFRRMEALNFTMEHDDGQLPADIEDADIVLVGISRTSKTPTSIYLANRGYKTVNIPIVYNVPLPDVLETAEHPLIVGLVATADRISQVRRNRVLGATQDYTGDEYTDRVAIAEELKFARNLCARHNWPTIDVSRRSIEETAAAILALGVKAR
ncbi:pyruvate, water dikinase regulatory protein [Hoeflea sp. TYP-13]|uniref:pyruvate, water dikinase regulatory protein n=1 Tax=Hoeflea sp. TYP-13 TaxID=3230023 RepID=UPI0034C6C806